jgi:hypothetical protein
MGVVKSSQSNPEPTLTDVLEKIEGLAVEVRKIDELAVEVRKIDVELQKFDQRFADYRQATQWVVQLAFTLIASATITVILTSIFK